MKIKTTQEVNDTTIIIMACFKQNWLYPQNKKKTEINP